MIHPTSPTIFRTPLLMSIYRYLIMFRPPAREICLNALEDVYQTCMSLPLTLFQKYPILIIHLLDEESRPSAGKILARWRPQKVAADQPQPQQQQLPNRAAATNGGEAPAAAS